MKEIRERGGAREIHLRVACPPIIAPCFYGIDKLRVADASIMPEITSGNTMAPCVVIGERAADFVKKEHRMAFHQAMEVAG